MKSLSTLLSIPPHRLRVIEGPLQGTIHPIPGRFRIGRSSAADLQLLDERVSREHAEIVPGPDGSYWLVDLDSSNGTMIDGKPVRRVQLRLNTIFRIQNNSFVFEEEIHVVGDNDETFVASYHRSPQRCGTIEYDASQLCGPTGKRQKSRKTTRVTRERMHPVVAMYTDGTPYDGNLVEDIAQYRTLQLRMARNEIHSTRQLDHYEYLAQRLHVPSAGPLRAPEYARLSCCFPATVRRASGQSLSVAMSDLGVDGARVLASGHELEPNEVVWLTIDLVTGPRMRTLVFTGEVHSTNAGSVGLTFSSPQEWCEPKLTHQQFDDGTLSNGTAAARPLRVSCTSTVMPHDHAANSG